MYNVAQIVISNVSSVHSMCTYNVVQRVIPDVPSVHSRCTHYLQWHRVPSGM